MRHSHPLSIKLPAAGVVFAESVHDADFRMAQRSDPFHKLVYVLDGRVAARFAPDFAVVPLSAGSAFLVPARVPHRFEDLAPATLLLLCFSPRLLAREADAASVWRQLAPRALRPWPLDRVAGQQLEVIWRRALHEQSHGRVGSQLAVRTLAIELALRLARLPQPEEKNAAGRRVAAVARAVGETFFEPWNLDRAAAGAGLSRRRFSTLFQAATGRTFFEHLTELRLAHAAQLLRGGEHSLLGVIFSCGFGDASNFYRAFRARFGVPPGAWAQRENAARPRPRAR